ncbi:MAG TPA: indole-3-glycerol phosphate synthase TrpC [Gemmatimonadaceae bacterium]
MQASGTWTPPTGTLGQILGETKARVDALRSGRNELERALAEAPPRPFSLAEALRRETVAVIAEVKRRSPSKGWIAEGLGAVEQAHAYADGGAAAISVLTEPAHFNGSIEDLRAVVEDVDLPVLRKDFHIDVLQLVEARLAGASAVLLIVRALGPALKELHNAARELGLESLVEIRDREELEAALEVGAQIIGINNRNLETLAIDPMTSDRLLPLIPPGVIAVAESGLKTADDVARVARVGADAVLMGSTLSGADDPEAAVRAVSSVQRVARGS